MPSTAYLMLSFPPACSRPALDETVLRAALPTLPSPSDGGRELRRVGEAPPSPIRSGVREDSSCNPPRFLVSPSQNSAPAAPGQAAGDSRSTRVAFAVLAYLIPANFLTTAMA